ncbi:hypothetical protein CPB86DRAFT_786807 [Serendipita vermifera]|nr:hypothetical protein CPB86DRAFT_786807 [Serendipita vermifera]
MPPRPASIFASPIPLTDVGGRISKDEAERPTASTISYKEGILRNHHALHLPSGDIVIHVEMAIFKVHTIFLTRHSEVIRDMIDVANHGGSENPVPLKEPLVLDDDVGAWEVLLYSFYREDPFVAFEPSEDDMLKVLEITHKYCMDKLEARVLGRIQENDTTQEGYINMLLASRIVGSRELSQKAIEGMIRLKPNLNWEQAKTIGFETYFDIMSRADPYNCCTCTNVRHKDQDSLGLFDYAYH